MKFEFTRFKNKIQNKFENRLTSEEIEDLLDINEEYSRDTPLSTGKYLRLEYISFWGKKNAGGQQGHADSIFHYEQTLENGINIWIADNLKGKSSILKIIKFALTGKNSIKNDVKKWLTHIVVNFAISKQSYTIYLNTQKRILGAYLFNGIIRDLDSIEKNKSQALIEVNGENAFRNKIQTFFFQQFSYYSLKWTQKNSAKDGIGLIEAGTSWATYYKSIFLESKDSTSLAFGDQEKKIIQMLLGLELTYAINRLSIRKDRLNEKKANKKLFSKMEFGKQSQQKDGLLERQSHINQALSEFTIYDQERLNLNQNYSDYSDLLKKIKEINKEFFHNENQIKALKTSLNALQDRLAINDSECGRLRKDTEKTIKTITDIHEYLEIGTFFSNLDIQHCPVCDNSVHQTTKETSNEKHLCTLCKTEPNLSVNSIDNERYEERIKALERLNGNRSKSIQKIKSATDKIKVKIVEIKEHLSILENKNKTLDDTASLTQQIKDIEGEINKEEAKRSRKGDQRREELIAEKAVIDYQLANMENSGETIDTSYESQIDFLAEAIKYLVKLRYNLSREIIKRLEDIMLNEMHDLGLGSISEVKISDHFEIHYLQNDELISFSHIAEGEQLRAKIAFYLSLIQLDIEFNFGRHTRILMIDSPGKEEGDANYIKGLSAVLKKIQDRFGDKLQILICTAERDLSGVVKNEYNTPENTFVF